MRQTQRFEASRLSSRRDFAALGGYSAPPPPRPERARRRWVAVLRWGLALSVLGAMTAVVGYWGLIFYFEQKLPEIFASEDYVAQTPQITRFFGSDGQVLAELGDERRTVVPAKDIPKLVKDAVLAAEDADFYQHDGLDYWGMLRAMYKNVREQRMAQGASTVTQQVARSFYLSAEKTWSRKIKEVVLARKLEQKLTKDEILYLYLNQIYWGHGRYGIAEAARFYFGKPLESLTVSDAALLAGVLPAPERYSPFHDLKRATERRAFVLEQMAVQGSITPEQADAAKHEPIRLNFRGDPMLGKAGYAMDRVREIVRDKVGKAHLRRGGLRVYTTIDSRLQREAQAALRKGLRSMDRAYDLTAPIEHVPAGRVPRYVARLARRVPHRGIRSGEVVLGVVTGVDAERDLYVVDMGLGPCHLPFSATARYRGRMKPGELYRVGDVLRVSPRLDMSGPVVGPQSPIVNVDQGPQGALAAIEPGTRHVKALVGGYDHATHPYDRATQARRQAGSTFKPIVFAAALESDIADPMTTFRNVPEVYGMNTDRPWKPKNFSGHYDLKLYTLRQALAKSINTIAVKIAEKTGVSRIARFAARIGIRSELPRDLSVALGSAAVSPMEMTNAYTTFASGGYVAEPVLVTRIEDWDGTVLWEVPRDGRLGTTPRVAFRITEMLRAVVEAGTGQVVRALGRPAAGKTGTTDGGVDTWFVGYTPNLVATVWVGFDDQRPVRGATGSKLAAPIWQRFMTAALEGTPVREFHAPAGITPLPPMGRAPVAEAPGPAPVLHPAGPAEPPPSEAPRPGSTPTGTSGPGTDLLYR